MSFTVIKPGLLDTLQDTGRFGYGSVGINNGGAMDQYAARIANMLAGNNTQEAVIECHFPGPQLLFEQNALISITGADFQPMLNDEEIPLWRPIVVRRNTILHFNRLQSGARCYIAVHGGLNVQTWLNSYSTNLKAGAGGHDGRRLEKDDELTFKESQFYYAGLLREGRDHQVLRWRVDICQTYQYPNEFYITPGGEFNQLTDTAKEDLERNNFLIHPFSDRMGYRLKGVPLERNTTSESLSSAVSFGTLQLLPDGQLIVLMADHQTTGGYPRIGHVITAHLPKLAQLRPSDALHFKLISQARAEALLFTMQRELTIIQRSCHDHLNELVC
ncbi:MAG: biotin-dependent carboxyltransferase family protein [Candidatus Pseudobacter hemicellulosilyticus]|uniref:Biotin-dependent carboxyltransferase family protein n=1 Tax=Candidatus Pseudobacter hemicellulosilyticus TaxID=3121375 RepID=A0AAJ5WTX9_9BACT|nr:MAG: biotin-dependent carboxyltransferase family protein [Pseudobacter sp.]